jgi:N-acetylglucosaminyldiphosphoundecaprenol N-acetyl-beta-D-mannosaminyltransferase
MDSTNYNKYRVLTVWLNAIAPSDVVKKIDEWIITGRHTYVLACSVNDIISAYDSSQLTTVINNADLAVPDGMPLVWIGRLHKQNAHRVYGPDLMLKMCEHSQNKGYRHFFYGSTSEVLNNLIENLQSRFPRITIAGSFSPPFRELSEEEKYNITEMINSAKPDIVWVGLGSPKQDLWAGEFRNRLNVPVIITVGAAFDFIAGRIPQAPRWMGKCGLEWAFRLATEPRRLWRRYLIGNSRFIFLIVRQLLSGKA